MRTSSTYKFDAFTDEETSALTYTFSVKRVALSGDPNPISTPKWITLVSATRTFTFTPTLSTHAGTYEVTVVATDAGIGGDAAAKKKTEESAEDVFELVVSAVNDAPEASAVPDKTVNEDATVTYQVLPFTDEDDDTTSASFTYVAQLVSSGTPGALPSWITFVKATRTFTFTPSDSSHVGDHTLRVTGTDDEGLSDFVDFKVTVAEVNDVPKKPAAGLADPDDVDEDTSSTYKFDAFTDEETSALTYTFSVKRVALNAAPNPISTPKWITLVSATRTFTFTPTLSTHAGTYEVTVVATDAGIGGDAAAKKNTEESAEDVFELVVSAVNDAPEASAVPDKTVDEDATVTYQVLPFTDEDDDTTSASFKYVAQLVSSGTLGALPSWIKFDADSSSATFRTFTFKPLGTHVGDHTLRVTGTDDEGLSDYVEFKVKVGEVNDAPAASSVPDKTVDEDATVTYVVPVFTDEEDDTTSAPFTYEAKLVVNGSEQNIPAGHWITFVAATRTFTFTPSAGHVGDYTLRVTGTDSGKLSASVEFKVTVGEVNDAPEAPTAALAKHVVDEDVASDHATATYVVPVFTDEEDDAASVSLTYTFSVVRVGAEGTLVDVSSWMQLGVDPDDASRQRFSFTPDKSSHAGRYKVTVLATDAGIGDDDATKARTRKSVSAAFELEVAEVNDAPEPPEAATLKNQEALEGLELTYEVPKFTDEEDDAASKDLTYVAQLVSSGTPGDLPLWIKFDADSSSATFRTFTFSPDKSSLAGDYRLRVTATDAGIGDDDATKESAYVEFMLKVIAVNDLPEGEALPNQSVTEDTPETYSFPKFTDEETSASALEHTASWVRKDSDGNDMKDADGEKVFVDLTDDDWIEFEEDPDDDTKMKFTFSPDKSWHAGVYTLRVTADDGQGGETSKVFLLQVSRDNDKPVASSLANQDDVVEDTSSTYEFDAFTDEENDAAGVSLKYTFSVVRVGAEGTLVD